jgi:hypothetical protein
MEDQAEGARRDRLRELDVILDALERLNLQEAKQLPDQVRSTLEGLGVKVGPRESISDLIERVWEMQERFLNPGTGEGGPSRKLSQLEG